MREFCLLSLRKILVGETGFEPAAPCSQNRCATKLRHSPVDQNSKYTLFFHK